jgi:hypothetical protein
MVWIDPGHDLIHNAPIDPTARNSSNSQWPNEAAPSAQLQRAHRLGPPVTPNTESDDGSMKTEAEASRLGEGLPSRGEGEADRRCGTVRFNNGGALFSHPCSQWRSLTRHGGDEKWCRGFIPEQGYSPIRNNPHRLTSCTSPTDLFRHC